MSLNSSLLSRHGKAIRITILLSIAASALIYFFYLGPWLKEKEIQRKAKSVTKRLEKLETAEFIYLEKHGRYGTMNQLWSEQLIDEELSSGHSAGYEYSVTVDKEQPEYFFAIHVSPETPGIPGVYYFLLDQSGVLRFNPTRPATMEDSSL